MIIKDPTQIFHEKKWFNDDLTPYYIFVLIETSGDQYFASIYTCCYANELKNKSCLDGRLVRLWSSLSEARISCFPPHNQPSTATNNKVFLMRDSCCISRGKRLFSPKLRGTGLCLVLRTYCVFDLCRITSKRRHCSQIGETFGFPCICL